jgi:hypothetical protein
LLVGGGCPNPVVLVGCGCPNPVVLVGCGCPNPVVLVGCGCPNPVVLLSSANAWLLFDGIAVSTARIRTPVKAKNKGKIIIEIGLCTISCVYEATTIL